MTILPDFSFEKSLVPQNCRFLLGIDEVGRGPWAGPVTLAGFIIDLNNFDEDLFKKLKIRDSKLLSEEERKSIYNYFKDNNYSFFIISKDSTYIDKFGIQNSIKSCVIGIIEHFKDKFDFVLLDGNYKFNICSNLKTIIKGDMKCFSIACASICAKYYRDQLMVECHSKWPDFDFANNKGYGTKKHQIALKIHGPTPIHRITYKPIKAYLSQ